MTANDFFHYAHVLAFAVILAVDIPAFYAAKLAAAPRASIDARLLAARVARFGNMLSSAALILILPVGVEIATTLGVYRLTNEVAITITWVISFAWLALWVVAEMMGASTLGTKLYTIEIWVRVIIGLGNVYDAIIGFMGTGLIETKWLATKVLLLGLVLVASGMARARLRPVRAALGSINPLSAQYATWDARTAQAVIDALKRTRPMIHATWLMVLIAAWMGVTKSW